ncbi:MarR family transcriptional regulator [Pelagibius litoralis]|uniref:MarR family transcriptional regulator n=1 Tax=Pelagibius litoralis TaxID=374515 RepID=A0A967CCE0_9PROT|nr:MarR family transcriptional regulator [Pelagibius litoralis]NIA69013.1 MarR family transcriptional regulator [Pelagibius litoralis]
MPKGTKSDAELDFLTAIEHGSVVTQVALKQHIGVSVGLINALMKRAVNKGYVKVCQAPYRRYAYYLTPQGFREKSRLVARYLETSLSFFREARGQYGEIFERAQKMGVKRPVLFGGGELAEIALLAASGAEETVVAVVDAQKAPGRSHGVPVIAGLDEIASFDGLVVTDASSPQRIYERLRESFPDVPIFAPALLRIVSDRADLIAATRRAEGGS